MKYIFETGEYPNPKAQIERTYDSDEEAIAFAVNNEIDYVWSVPEDRNPNTIYRRKKMNQYMSWFREVVEMGWTCGLYQPQEILLNYLMHYHQFAPYDEPLPYDHIERFMIDVTTSDYMSLKPATLAAAVKWFNEFYLVNNRTVTVDFGVYVRNVHAS